MTDTYAKLHDELKSVWSSILQTEVSGIDDDFYDLGGDSLQLIQVVVAISSKYKVDFDYDIFFEEPTIATLADLIGGAVAARASGAN